jgi:hypothetical protein
MNYGRFFRLNQTLSKVVDGVAIYDYVDLPAYFGPSIDNPMSPKYPISVTITAEMVCFRLHYSAFKIDKSGDGDFPQYAYDKDDIDTKSLKKGVSMGMAHMEEIVLELPFANISSSRLPSTIKKIYNSTFPQVMDENTSMGGRYLEQLIKKRFPIKIDDLNEKNEGCVEDIIYRNLRKMSDETASYSTLWLMDLVREDRIYLYSKQIVKDEKTRKEKKIDVVTGFLRKLLLDFMFDLKHSDVFQNSACYQKMYSGLMSDFYFSALMHKCEYYYYRKLIREAVNEKEYNRETLVTLYAEELFRAEELWIKDIMSSQAEDHFDYFHDGKHLFWKELKEDGIFEKFPSWFADPEEEMRRVCFTMREKDGSRERHMCNMDILIKLLDISRDAVKPNTIESQMIKMRDDSYRLISQWFLKRYDFKDLFHLHMFKYSNSYLITVLVISLLLMMPFLGMDLGHIAVCGCGLFCLLHFYRWFAIYLKNAEKKNEIDKRRNEASLGRIKWTGFTSFLFTLALACNFFQIGELWKGLANYVNNIDLCHLIVISILFISPLFVIIPWKRLRLVKAWKAICISLFPLEPKLQHVMSNLHLLLPRLVASITASWITLSMGFDLYVSFFDATPAWATVTVLLAILLLFVMYEINSVTPNSCSWIKLFRSLELIVISYTISLIVGIVVINFLGERYLEKGGYVGDDEFYKQYVETNNGFKDIGKNKRIDKSNKNSTISVESIQKLQTKDDSVKYMLACIDYIFQKAIQDDSLSSIVNYYKRNVANLDSVYHVSKSDVNSKYPLVEHIHILGGDVFILRNFLIMFAFIAMFTGIFIQLIIFGDNKQMTEL